MPTFEKNRISGILIICVPEFFRTSFLGPKDPGIPDFFGLSASSGSAGYSAQGAGDIEAKVYGKEFNIEVRATFNPMVLLINN